MTRDEYEEDLCCDDDEHPGPWLALGFAAMALLVAWAAWMVFSVVDAGGRLIR